MSNEERANENWMKINRPLTSTPLHWLSKREAVDAILNI